jgi:hypothetical protein
MVQVLEREIFPLVKGFKDTPFIVYMLKTQLWQNEKYIERVYFEQEVGLNRHWLQARRLSSTFSRKHLASYDI